jgi:SSS family solute:Na+ symporter
MYTFVGPPFSTIFLLGMLWKRVSGKDALITVIFSFCLSILLKYLEFGPLADSTSAFASFVKPFPNQGLITWAFSMIVCTISTLLTAPAKPEQVGEGLIFSFKNKTILREGLGTKWYNKVIFWWSICFGLMLLLILYFSVFVK